MRSGLSAVGPCSRPAGQHPGLSCLGCYSPAAAYARTETAPLSADHRRRARHALVRNLRRGHYDITTDVPARHRLRRAFSQLSITI